MPDQADSLAQARLALRCLDLTSLNDADTEADVDRGRPFEHGQWPE